MSTGAWGPLAHLLEARAAERSDGVATWTVDGDTRSWGELDGAARDVAERLREVGVEPGARVGFWAPNRADWGSGLFGIWRAGATSVVLSALARPDEVSRITAAAGLAALVTVPASRSQLAEVEVEVPVVELGSDGAGAPSPPGGPGGGAPASLPEEAVVVYTAGTTGEPKGIVHAGTSILASLRAMSASSGLDATDPRPLDDTDRHPNLVLTPLSHVSGFMALLFAWWAGKPLVVVDRFTPETLTQVLDRHDVRVLRLIPTMVYDLVQAPDTVRLEGVRYATVGTAALDPDLRRRFEERFGFPLLVTYGQSEAMGGVAAERLEDVRAGIRPPGGVGRPLPGVDVRIVDPETGTQVGEGEVGEIVVSTPQVMRRYLGGQGDAPVDGDGFLHTGDLGRFDGGILSVVGRARDVVVSGGFNVYPAEVEAALTSLPAVDAAAVVGLPDERLGEIAVAAVVSRDGRCDPVALDRAVREHLASYKRPRAYLGVDALPLTEGGKLDRRALADHVAGRREELLTPGS